MVSLRMRTRGLIATAALMSLITSGAVADSWPSRPLRLIVPVPPGGSADAVARAFADGAAPSLGQTIVVDNRPGGNSNIAAETVMRAPADGYTLLLMNLASAAMFPHFRKLPYDPFRDFVPVNRIVDMYFGMAVHPSVPANDLASFIAYAKANPGKVNFASTGLGGSLHLAAEMFNHEAGTNLYHVPYKGSGEALADLMAGHVQVMFEGVVFPAYQAGKVKVFGVTTPERRKEWPEIPAIREVVPSYDFAIWFGVAAPRGTPPDVVARLSAALNEAARKPAIQDRVLPLGMVARTDTPAEMLEDMHRQSDKFGKLIRDLGIKEE